MKKTIDHWEGQIEYSEIEYDTIQQQTNSDTNSEIRIATGSIGDFSDRADKTDYLVSASCGLLTGLLDVFWVGEFSLSDAQDWGRSKANSFVIKVAQMRGYGNTELDGAIRYLENDAPIPSDQLTSIWGGALQHHFRDFAHHASIVGLVFSIMTQFTGLSYGTNTEGVFESRELPNKELIGESFKEKLFNGTVIWILHLVSDMSGSRNTAGKGTGIPGPLLSLAKELSVLPKIRDLKITYKGDQIDLSIMLSKIFNGTAFNHTSNKDLKRFDLRTEMGVYAYGVKQSIPVVINQCIVRAFYFVKRLCIEISNKQIKGIKDISQLNPKYFIPYNNTCILRMLTISSGVFFAVDASDAAIRSYMKAPQSKTELFTQLLLRTNFVGIGNFIISIKNDISANMLGHCRIQSDGNQTSEPVGYELSNEAVNIDVAVEIDNTKIYDFAFGTMYNRVKTAKEDFSGAQSVANNMERCIIQLEDDETQLFNYIAKASSRPLRWEIQKLVMRLFTLYGVEYVPFDDKASQGNPMPFYRMEDGKKIGYLFSYSMTERIKGLDTIKEEYNVDGIKVVALVELGEDSKTLNPIVNSEVMRAAGIVRDMTIKELFSLISEREYDIFMSYVKKFNDDINKLIGYRTIVVPSDSSVYQLKNDILDELRGINFDEKLVADGLYENQIEQIKKNFWERGMHRALVGNSSFSESFISSEWYFRNHVKFSVLEQTAVIVGYLKSVEQLLYAIVKLSEGTGKQIKKYGGAKGEYVEYCTENEDLIDSTLGSIIGYVRHYSDLWDVNGFVKNYVVNRLNTFREKYRNDHLHKDNIKSVAEIEEIRENTIFLYFLLLGAMKIQDNDKEKLGITTIEKESKKKKNISYPMIEAWLNRIISGDVLLPKTTAIYIGLTEHGQKQWKLDFATISGCDDRGFPQDSRFPYIGDELIWDQVKDREETEEEVISLINEYLKKGLYSGNLKTYSAIYVGHMRPKKLYP